MFGYSASTLVLISLLPLATIGFFLGKLRAVYLTRKLTLSRLIARPAYYGTYSALWCTIPPLVVWLLWMAVEKPIITGIVVSEITVETLSNGQAQNTGLLMTEIMNVAEGRFLLANIDPEIQRGAELYADLQKRSHYILYVSVLMAALAGGLIAAWRISPLLPAREKVEQGCRFLLLGSSLVTIGITLGIIASLIFETLRFFNYVSPIDFIFGTRWNPQMAMRSDQVASAGAFGALGLFLGTGLISVIAMSVAGPVGLFSAIYLSQYASSKARNIAKPLLEVLAGIPTVVYGFFAALTVAPRIRDVANSAGLNAASESALAAGLVMGVMIIPFVSSLSDDMLHAVPRSLKEGSLALGATESETIVKVLIPAALPGIVGAFLLAISRAIGETMIVVMAAGLTANLTINPLESVTTVTVQIVSILVGDQEFDSPKTLSAFALGSFLFITTLCLNFLAQRIVKRYREQYE